MEIFIYTMLPLFTDLSIVLWMLWLDGPEAVAYLGGYYHIYDLK